MKKTKKIKDLEDALEAFKLTDNGKDRFTTNKKISAHDYVVKVLTETLENAIKAQKAKETAYQAAWRARNPDRAVRRKPRTLSE